MQLEYNYVPLIINTRITWAIQECDRVCIDELLELGQVRTHQEHQLCHHLWCECPESHLYHALTHSCTEYDTICVRLGFNVIWYYVFY